MATVTMSATLKVGDNDTPIQIGDIKPITESDVDENNLVIFYNGSYYGSDGFVCTHFEGVNINFKVSIDKVEEPKLVKTGVFAMDNPPSGNYVRIKCDKGSKFYNVSESVVSGVDNKEVDVNDIDVEFNEKEEEQRPAAETTNQADDKIKQMATNNMMSIFTQAKQNVAQKKTSGFTDIMTNKGGKRSRKAYRKSGRKASRKYGRKPSRKAYRKSVANKKRNRGTRKK